MSKTLVLYYSAYGHIALMADAIAEGARSTGAEAVVKRVPDIDGVQVARAGDPVATIDELAGYDAIVIGTGTRFGRMSSPMASFLDQAGGLWATGALNGKVGGSPPRARRPRPALGRHRHGHRQYYTRWCR